MSVNPLPQNKQIILKQESDQVWVFIYEFPGMKVGVLRGWELEAESVAQAKISGSWRGQQLVWASAGVHNAGIQKKWSQKAWVPTAALLWGQKTAVALGHVLTSSGRAQILLHVTLSTSKSKYFLKDSCSRIRPLDFQIITIKISKHMRDTNLS